MAGTLAPHWAVPKVRHSAAQMAACLDALMAVLKAEPTVALTELSAEQQWVSTTAVWKAAPMVESMA